MVELRAAPADTVTYALAQAPYAPTAYKDSLAHAERMRPRASTWCRRSRCGPRDAFGLSVAASIITHPTYDRSPTAAG